MSTEKPWDRPWSMEEIIENSDKWSLAGDVALLNTLKSIADNLISRTTDINNTLHNLTNRLDETGLQLNIAQNEFQSLRNNQFIESRVYEDDETLPQPENNGKVEDKTEPDRTEDIRVAALKGLEVLNQYFDKIEVSVSDSEDEDIDLPNYLLRPKDLYLDRPLPYVIGTEEWHKSWHVGLEDSSSDSETEKVSDKYSESDSESDLPIIQDRSQIKGTSDTSSELDFSQKIEVSKRSISSKQDLFHSSDSEDQNSMPVQAPISNKNFAEELAAKLGNVINQEYEEPQINRRPIQKTAQYAGDLFFDEPPPLDAPKGLFSGGSGLFDDDDDDVMQYSTPNETKVEETQKIISKKPISGLFDEDGSDEDIFSSKKPVLQSSKPVLFSDEPPALEEKKKPVGGVSIFGGADLFNKKLLKRQPSSDDETDSSNKETVKEEKVKIKKIDLFADDDDELFKTTEKAEKSIVKNANISKINLFESDDEEEDQKNSLFDEGPQTSQKQNKNGKSNVDVLFKDDEDVIKQEHTKEVKRISLFDDDDDLFKEDVFSNSTKNKFSSGLFDDVNIQSDDLFSNKTEKSKSTNNNLFEDLTAIRNSQNSVSATNVTEEEPNRLPTEEKNEVETDENSEISKVASKSNFGSDSLFEDSATDQTKPSKAPKPKPRISLFDSPPPETDDLFSDGTVIDSKPGEEKKNITEDFASSSIFESPSNKDVVDNEENDSQKKSSTLFDSSFEDDQNDLFNEKPSKNSSNLFTSSIIESKEDIFTEKKVEEPPKTATLVSSMRLFDPVPPPDDEWDTKSDNISEENESFTDQDDVASQKLNLFSEEPPSLDFFRPETGKVSNITEKLENEPKEEIKQNLSSPGKLKHNLKINVNALMPGFLPPKRDLHKSPSLEKAEDGPPTEDKTSFDTTDNVEVLHSITKDRAKVPLNRRPSTRRGRKAALRNSTSDFQLDQDPDSLVVQNVIEESPKSTKQTDDDDLLNVKPSKPSAPKSDLFGDDEDDDDDDMFSSKKVSVQPTKVLKKSLFDDDDTDEDDDIFKSSSNDVKVKSSEIKIAPEKKIAKVSSIKKLENKKLDDDDPLSALLK